MKCPLEMKQQKLEHKNGKRRKHALQAQTKTTSDMVMCLTSECKRGKCKSWRYPMSLQFQKHREIKAMKKENKMEFKIEYIEITPSANPFELIRDFNEEMVIEDPKSNNEDELGTSAVVLLDHSRS